MTVLSEEFPACVLVVRSDDHVGEISSHALSVRIRHDESHVQSRQRHAKVSAKLNGTGSLGQSIYRLQQSRCFMTLFGPWQ